MIRFMQHWGYAPDVWLRWEYRRFIEFLDAHDESKKDTVDVKELFGEDNEIAKLFA